MTRVSTNYRHGHINAPLIDYGIQKLACNKADLKSVGFAAFQFPFNDEIRP
ncbi:MAG: hypothetical protein IPO77_17940 [Acidobacteria bacterium]|nr:hypothetical protein [Acidobacteriota bacterium]